MKDLIISSSDYNHITHMIDEAEISARFGNQVYFLLCNRNFGYCACNLHGSRFKCLRCERYAKRLLRECSSNVHVIEMDKRMAYLLREDVCKINFNYQSVSDIKSIEYKGAKVGMGCMSAYITYSRNNNPLIDDQFRAYFDRLLRTGCYFAEFQYRMIRKIQPDRIQLFNGRCLETRSASDFALNHHILLKSCEQWRVFPNRFLKRVFYNSLPHDITVNKVIINSLWNHPLVPLSEKEMIGKRFFESKYNHSYSGDKDYAVNQLASKLPNNWDSSKKNYVIFNSSEDEFSAVSEEYEKGRVFKTQYEGILYIANRFKDQEDVNIYLRIHPNLSKIPYKYHTDLLKISEQFHNLFVIRGDSEISSYALMREAYRVITFGSTTGVEASYMGKPVIALWPNWYSGLDVCYFPTSVRELDSLLDMNNLSPKPQMEAIKCGYVLMSPNLPSFSFFDYNISDFRFLGRTLRRYNLATYFGSNTLYSIVGWFLEFLCKRDIIPTKEA